jgi:hypothetical protein
MRLKGYFAGIYLKCGSRLFARPDKFASEIPVPVSCHATVLDCAEANFLR